MPAARRLPLAGWLSTLPPREVFRDSQPVMAGTWSAVERVDELVASQLWIEVRSFKWRRTRKVAANILINTRVGVLREVGDFFYVSRADRTWANTTLVESFSAGDLTSVDGGAGYSAEMPTERVAGALFHRPEILADAGPEQEEPSATEELLELLAWACDHKVSPADRYLLLCLVEEADRVETRRLARGYGGLLSNEVSSRSRPASGSLRRPSVATALAPCAPSPRPPRGSSAMTNKPGSDRSRHPATHRRLEVVKPMTNTHDGETRKPEQIAELFAIAGREIEAIEQLTGCVAQLHEVQAAKAQLRP
ncbi:hypothetical protein I601_4161 [Nocardioides dokdonensis FR1436]|uniref:Uncharacterized protein n=1 Tax=Nocardioides dokdonensis FR1436 TaxID=1300347 RepID=A0A1A9GR64_9ACTN|nr:hypothetical protein [Nocardioides dokdonensis]ANH40556.1 hypothetical protein I601_4161 [Nocardioides dokdonensis FR1436]